MELKELIKDLAYTRQENINACTIAGITPNSNCVRPGYLFVAIKGDRFDGHSFLNQAIGQGAAGLILERDLPVNKKIAKIIVHDSADALAFLNAVFFDYPARKLKVIGITGTNGKTTVSFLIEKILAAAGYSSAVIGTINYRLGKKILAAPYTTPGADILQSFLQETVQAQSKYAILEVSSHALAQSRVKYVDFSYAVFTNLSPEHLDYHQTLDKYFSCKASLFEQLTHSSWSIINIDDPYGRKLNKRIKSQQLTYGIEHPAQIRAKDIKSGLDKLNFTVVTPQGNLTVESPLIGKHNVYNILAAIGVAFCEHVDFAHIISGIKDCTCVSGRLERIDCGQDFLVFVDYAHTDDALKKVLSTLRQSSQKRIILVFGCGGDRDTAKRPRMGRVACELADLAILTTDNPRSEAPERIIADIVKGIDKKRNNYKVILDRFEAIREACSLAARGDIVVIAGKGHEQKQILGNKTVPFNDRQAAEEIIQCLQLKKY